MRSRSGPGIVFMFVGCGDRGAGDGCFLLGLMVDFWVFCLGCVFGDLL